MKRAFAHESGRLKPLDVGDEVGEKAVWIDLLNPTSTEEKELEERLNVDVPTKEEMEEIEISSRLYREGDAAFMTAILPANADGDYPYPVPGRFDPFA